MSQNENNNNEDENKRTLEEENKRKIEERRIYHKEIFEKWLNQEYNKRTTSKIMSQEKSKAIIDILKSSNEKNKENELQTKQDPNFKHFVKKKFQLLVDNGVETIYRSNRPVAIRENFFDILYNIHSLNNGHVGINKTYNLADTRYYGIPQVVVKKFINFCSICNCKQPQAIQPRLKPIRSDEFLSRIQLDLVDMRNKPCKKDGKTYQWIAHIVDHFSKFHILWPQQHKTAEEVVDGLRKFVFPYFGLPKILQCDYGKEFKNKDVISLIKDWGGECKIKHGRPRHPQSQGLVEQANGTMERMIASYEEQYMSQDWVSFLPKIMFNLNTQLSLCILFYFYFLI